MRLDAHRVRGRAREFSQVSSGQANETSMANREMAHLRDDPEAGFGGATELVDSTVLLGGARSSLPNGGYELPEPSVSADASDDSLTTPLLVGEASHVAEKKIGRHRRRSTNAGAHGWVTAP